MDTLIGIGILAAVILVLGVIAILRCDPADIADVLRALSRFVGHPDHQPPARPVRPAARRRRLGAGTSPPRRQDASRPRRGRSAARRSQRRRVKRYRGSIVRNSDSRACPACRRDRRAAGGATAVLDQGIQDGVALSGAGRGRRIDGCRPRSGSREGLKPPEVGAGRLRVSSNSVYAWWLRWCAGGEAALGVRGRPGGAVSGRGEAQLGPAAGRALDGEAWLPGAGVQDQRWTLDRVHVTFLLARPVLCTPRGHL